MLRVCCQPACTTCAASGDLQALLPMSKQPDRFGHSTVQKHHETDSAPDRSKREGGGEVSEGLISYPVNDDAG